jgi:hypothetical protein
MTHPSLARLGHFTAPLQATCSTCGAVKDAKEVNDALQAEGIDPDELSAQVNALLDQYRK